MEFFLIAGAVPVDDLNTVTKVFSAVLTTLVAAMSWMGRAFWRKSNDTEEKLVKRWEASEQKREQENAKVLELSREVGTLKGHVDGYSEAKKSMETLHSEVLQHVVSLGGKDSQ